MPAPSKTRAELRRDYKETPRQSGIFQIKNTKTGKILLGSSTNLHGPLNKHRFMLSIGRHDNVPLQNDWKQFGPEAFAFEILEVVKPSDQPAFCLEDELTLLEQIWLEKLQPFGERGYNRGPIRRD
ncbi:MAG TPA: GIY-YIG nuclease family protein [Polyangia bacterium]